MSGETLWGRKMDGLNETSPFSRLLLDLPPESSLHLHPGHFIRPLPNLPPHTPQVITNALEAASSTVLNLLLVKSLGSDNLASNITLFIEPNLPPPEDLGTVGHLSGE
ncbi:hypothetical protein P7K49_025526 [Saguinus oedipus]|uniref:Uncharacterized protein n=1 Tax=Saguinus oedipus TaxID=9490 RepID=A0ABQ9UHF2_SAGOE|nr:hypothetical protein P7K49_025526 [Saguinus oedipus]